MNFGEPDRGLAEVRHAQELDPLSLVVNTVLGMAYYRLHEYDQATAQLRKTLELDPNFSLARQVLAQTFDMQGRLDEAIAECRKGLEASDAPAVLATLAHAYARKGNAKEALEVLQQLKAQSERRFVAASNFAWVYLGLGDKEEALNWLEKAYEDGSAYGIKMDPFFDPLRGEPRFEQLIDRVFAKTKSPPSAGVAIPEKSIAVLPFAISLTIKRIPISPTGSRMKSCPIWRRSRTARLSAALQLCSCPSQPALARKRNRG